MINRPKAVFAAQAALCVTVGVKMTDAFYDAAMNGAASVPLRVLDGLLVVPSVAIGATGLYGLVKVVKGYER